MSQQEQVDIELLRKQVGTASGSAAWGSITGTLSSQSDLNAALSGKQGVLAEGAFTNGDKTKLDAIAAGAEVNPDVVSQAEAEAGTATTERIWTAERVAQAIAALASGGGGTVTLQASTFQAWQGTPTFTTPTPASGLRASQWRLSPSTVDDAIMASIPQEASSWGSFDVVLWTITASTAATGGARLIVGINSCADGVAGETSVLSNIATHSITGGSTGRVQRHTIASGVTPNADEWHSMFVYRIAGDAADTYSGELGILGVELVRAS